jgi:hypothetical protein
MNSKLLLLQLAGNAGNEDGFGKDKNHSPQDKDVVVKPSKTLI